MKIIHLMPWSALLPASSSGKLTKNDVRRWLRDVFAPDVKKAILLLLDSWRGQIDDTIFTDQEVNNTLHGKTKQSLQKLQSLHVYFFR